MLEYVIDPELNGIEEEMSPIQAQQKFSPAIKKLVTPTLKKTP